MSKTIYEPMVFESVTLIEIPVKLGDGNEYLLQEASGEAATMYANMLSGAAVFNDQGKPVGIKGVANIEPVLVSMCLVQVIRDADGAIKSKQRVSQKTVASWPAHVQRALFNRIKEISQLDEPLFSGLLASALEREDSPVSLEDFRAWVDALPNEYKPLREAVKVTSEQSAKN